ncbi:MAG: HAD family phosphatase [Clostridiales bacterium]|jgi:beta-phosphoglucomutase|nr:HAD family phosphatase [Clostridiales bacterium]
MKAIVFDFNGTMFLDGEKHRRAWGEFLERRLGRAIGEQEFLKYAWGPTNDRVLRHFFGEQLTADEIDALGEEKEAIYRRICLEEPETLKLTAGLPEFLDKLREGGVPMAIATGAGIANLRFYFETFGLSRWFPPDRVIYDDGRLPGKPDPAIYIAACALLCVEPKDCTVFEDSLAGIESARAAGIGEIVALATSMPAEALKKMPGVARAIRDFREFSIQSSM